MIINLPIEIIEISEDELFFEGTSPENETDMEPDQETAELQQLLTTIKQDPHINIEQGNHLLIRTKICGIEGMMIIDTGASQTVLDIFQAANFISRIHFPEAIHTAGVSPSKIEMLLGKVDEIWLYQNRYTNLTVGLTDLRHVIKIFEKAKNLKVFGLLGGDFLRKHNAIIDYQAEKLTIEIQ